MTPLHQQLSAARKAAGLTQEALGRALGLAPGSAQATIARYEAGGPTGREPPLRHVRGIATATGRAIVIDPEPEPEGGR